MAITVDIFSLYQAAGPDCRHYALLRVERPAYRNAIQPEEDRAYAEADERLTQLLQFYQAALLPDFCSESHQLTLLGTFEGEPPGEVLYADHGQASLEIWTAESSYGPPYIVVGTAPTEAQFWAEIDADELLGGHRAQPPARKLQVYFITERDRSIL